MPKDYKILKERIILFFVSPILSRVNEQLNLSDGKKKKLYKCMSQSQLNYGQEQNTQRNRVTSMWTFGRMTI